MSSASTTFVSMGSPTAAQVNGWSQGTLGYAQVVANQAAITAEVALTSLAVTLTVVAGRRLKITAKTMVQNTAAGNQQIVSIKESATYLNQGAIVSGAISVGESMSFEAIVQPSAGSHTYSLVAQAVAGTSTLVANANNPSFILVEDIGAV